MIKSSFEFSLGNIGYYCGEPLPSKGAYVNVPLPSNYSEIVNLKGERFRDHFTRVCLYLSSLNIENAKKENDHVIVGTEYGNIDSMVRFQKQAKDNDKEISAQQFPYATTSSASTFINIDKEIKGGNVTLNAGVKTPLLAFLYSLLKIKEHKESNCHIFVGDIYSDLALEDAEKKNIDKNKITPAVTYGAILQGTTYRATLAQEDRVNVVKKIVLGREHDFNQAVVFNDFLCSIRTMPILSCIQFCSLGDQNSLFVTRNA